MYLIEITEDRYEHLVDNVEKGLRHLGKAMQCLDEMGEEHGYGHRGGRPGRGGMKEDPDYQEWLKEREHRDKMEEKTGRYSRY